MTIGPVKVKRLAIESEIAYRALQDVSRELWIASDNDQARGELPVTELVDKLDQAIRAATTVRTGLGRVR